MQSSDLIEQRQYAEKILSACNFRPFTLDLVKGVLRVSKGKTLMAAKLCKIMQWPMIVETLPSKK